MATLVRVRALGLQIGKQDYTEGDQALIPDELAAQLCDAGAAERVAAEKPVVRRERATKAQREMR